MPPRLGLAGAPCGRLWQRVSSQPKDIPAGQTWFKHVGGWKLAEWLTEERGQQLEGGTGAASARHVDEQWREQLHIAVVVVERNLEVGRTPRAGDHDGEAFLVHMDRGGEIRL